MLTICSDPFPQTSLSYLAFRVAFQETLERIWLAEQVADSSGHYGYLTEVPFLKAVAPHVQLDLLAETWRRHVAPEAFEADLVDESVVYAICETAARIVENEPAAVDRFLDKGPMGLEIEVDNYLAAELRSLHLNMSNDGDFLLISQFEDIPPQEARHLKRQFGIDEMSVEPMFAVLSRWYLAADFLSNLEGLLTEKEIEKVIAVLGLE